MGIAWVDLHIMRRSGCVTRMAPPITDGAPRGDASVLSDPRVLLLLAAMLGLIVLQQKLPALIARVMAPPATAAASRAAPAVGAASRGAQKRD